MATKCGVRSKYRLHTREASPNLHVIYLCEYLQFTGIVSVLVI